MGTKETLFIGAFFIVGVIYEFLAVKMPIGTLAYPGPGFYPNIIGIFLIFTTGGCLFRSIARGRAAKGSESGTILDDQQGTVLTRILANKTMLLIGTLLFYALFLPWLGFAITILLTMLMSCRIFGLRRWLLTLFIAVSFTVISYIVFVTWLKVPLP